MEYGIYEELVNKKILKEINDENLLIGKEKLDPEEAKSILTQYIYNITRKSLEYVRDSKGEDKEKENILKQISICNNIIDALKEDLNDEDLEELKISDTAEVLTYVYSKINRLKLNEKEIKKPEKSISRASLFTGSKIEPSLDSEIKNEIASCDEIYMLVSFIRWSGLRTILEELKEFTNSGKKLKIITTAYMGATEVKAIEELAKLENAEIKISYDVDRTRLHAKSYIFKRNNGFTTAYIGSSNMSYAAMTSGLEWNVKLCERETSDVITKMLATFEMYWNDSLFELFALDEYSKERLKKALKKSSNKVGNKTINFEFDIKPYAYQKEILESLKAEREIFGRYKNLVVAATGVGKTVISAFDYKSFRESNSRARILFVAHREEILEKSLDTFRYILKDNNFGDLFVGSHKAESIENLFISIQSFNSSKLIERTTPDFYDYIIIDEVHHGAAASYKKLLEYYKPKILLGLTATPERTDGLDITQYFDEKMAYEMRLPEAIDNKLLCPFQYFGISDTIDLSEVRWTRNGYDESELEKVYVFDTQKAKTRAQDVIRNTIKYVSDIDETKGLGFCVGVEHAKFMAKEFNDAGIPSIYLTGNSDDDFRKNAKQRLVSGEIKFIFTVDLFNEGVDIPEINTVLFLRPTKSLTIFIQQLGRGLRICKDKECLTVLDFIGQANQNYKFAEKFRGLIGSAKKSVEHYVKNGFDFLPRGCYISLEKQAKEYVLRNLKGLKTNKDNIIRKIKYFEEDTGKKLTLKNFITEYDIDLKDFYKKRTFTRFCTLAGIIDNIEFEYENIIENRIPLLLSIDSPKLLKFAKEYINNPYIELDHEKVILRNMLYYTFYDNTPTKLGLGSINEGLIRLFKNEYFKKEILEIIDILYENINCIPKNNNYEFVCPLEVYCTYTKSQILAGLEYYKENFYGPMLEGVKYFKDREFNTFFITLNKSDKDFSEATLYEDYAINDELFHWETQNSATQDSKVVKRYINSNGRVSLFVRENKKENGVTSPYIYLGECEYVSHEGNKPVSFIWKLKNKIPAKFLSKVNKSAL